MSDLAVQNRRPTIPGHRAALGSLTWVWVPLTIFAASRLVSTVLLLLAGRDQVAPPWGPQSFPDDPSLRELLGNWDGGWYHRIATEGYPSELPRTDGVVSPNPWAFYPLVPSLARLVMATGIDFVWAASFVSTIASAAACVMLFSLLRQRAGRFTASMGVATLVLGPVGLIFQTTYTEGPALLLVLLALRALASRRCAALTAFGLLLAFTRPITLALAAVCALTWVVLWWRRAREPFPVDERVRLAAATLVIGASFIVWPTVAGLVTGERDAYRLTQSAWINSGGSWATWLAGGLTSTDGLLATAVGLVAIALVAWVVIRPEAGLWSREARLWSVLYTLFILAATRPTPSVLRYLVLAFLPFWPLPELSERCRTTSSRLTLAAPTLVLCVLSQWWWTSTLWVPHDNANYPP